MRLALYLIFLVASYIITAQERSLRLDLDKEKGTYLCASMRGQFWLRYIKTNPGTTFSGKPVDEYLDLSVRRIRMSVSGLVSPRVFFYGTIGGNNLNRSTTSDFRLRLLDFYTEYRHNKYIHIGAGKSAFQGLSRWNNRSTITMLVLDAPIFVLSTINRLDDLGRNLGIWLKGDAGPLDYRAVINTSSPENTEPPGPDVDFAADRSSLRYSTYVKYQFFEKELNSSAFASGTYLGKKKVLAVGAGALFQEDATWSLSAEDTAYYDIFHLAADVFMELPLNRKAGNAITAYAGIFNYDFGGQYIRNIAANNPGFGSIDQDIFNGGGHSFPMIGTGLTSYVQCGYLFSDRLTGRTRLQPYYAMQLSSWERLDQHMVVQDIGFNWYIDGHRQKLSFNTQIRPVFEKKGEKVIVTDHESMFILQYQILIK